MKRPELTGATAASTAPALLPGPARMPLIGARGNYARFMFDAVGCLERLHGRYGEIAALARGTGDYVCVFSPQYNEFLLSDTELFHNLDAASSPVHMPDGTSLRRLYTGLTNMNGPQHRRQRQLMASALRRTDVEEYAPDIVALTEWHTASWRVGGQVDLLAEMRALTLAVAVRTLLGLDPDRDGLGASRLLQAWMDAVFSMPALAIPLDLPGLPYRRLMVLSRRLERVIRGLIGARRGRSGPDALSRLIRANDEHGCRLTDDELVGQTAFLFMAGHATTASALTWTLLLLCLHPRVWEELLAELDTALHGRPPHVAELARLELLDRVIRESLRLLPPVMWWGRVSTRPFELGPYQLAEGSNVIYSSYVTHRLPRLYLRPRRFEPDRWLTIDPGPYEYLPFSSGPRMCLGVGFAMLELRLVLAMLLQRWRPEVVSGSRIDRGGLMVSHPKGGLPVTLGPSHGAPRRTAIRGNIRTMVDIDD